VHHNATRLAANLRQRGVRQGDRVVLSFDTSPEFLESFFACSLLGAIPCLVELPSSKAGINAWGERLRGKMELLGARGIIIDPDFLDMAQESFQGFQVEGFTPFAVGVKDLVGEAEPFEPPTLAAEDVAFIQFTSGTTASARGIQISTGRCWPTARTLARRAGGRRMT
jgi:acyl-CoA synthetase (AMP-forming)/AMP-acid ligase II